MSRDTQRIVKLEEQVAELQSLVGAISADLHDVARRVTALEQAAPTPDPVVEPAPEPEPEPQPEPEPTASPLARIFGCPTGPRPHELYDTTFAEWGDLHWSLHPGDNFAYGYYDRTLVWYAAWWRGLGDEYLARAAKEADTYLTQYVIPNEYKIPPRWVFVEGLAVHYLKTGDERALAAITGMADRLWSVWGPQLITTYYLDGRVQGRTVLAQIIAYELTGEQVYNEQAKLGVAALQDWFLGRLGGTGKWPMTSYGYGQANFQVAHAALYALTRHLDLSPHLVASPFPAVFVLEEILEPTVLASLDWMWQQWDGTAFPYVSDVIDNTDGHNTGPAPDLNLLIAPAFQWAGQTDRVRQIVDAGLEHTWFGGYKQFNQSFMRSWLCL